MQLRAKFTYGEENFISVMPSLVSPVGDAAALSWQQGYCALTQSNSGACATDDKGSWTIRGNSDWVSNALFRAECLQRCEACERCVYVSFSSQESDCSWFASCAADASDPWQ